MGEEYTHPGAKAEDDVDGDVTILMAAAGLAAISTAIPTLPDAPFVI